MMPTSSQLLERIKKKPRTAIQKQQFCKPGSVSCTVMIMRVTYETGKPLRLDVVPLENVVVPYIFRPPKTNSTKIIKQAVPGAMPLTFIPGDATMQVSQFSPALIPIVGRCYRLDGVSYDIYQETLETPMVNSITCARISMEIVCDMEKEICKIPFINRSFNPKRDLAKEDPVEYAKDTTWRFVYIKIDDLKPDDTDNIYGRFSVQPRGEEVILMFSPKDKAGADLPAIQALTGGRVGSDVVDNQIAFIQMPKDGPAYGAVALLKLYGISLEKLQVEWLKLGGVCVPNLYGDLYATINRKKTSGVVAMDDNDAYCISGVFMPDCAKMAKKGGFKMKWDNAAKLAPSMLTPTAVTFDGDMDYTRASALNIVRSPFDISLIKAAEAKGLIELYVMTNRNFSDDDRRQKFSALPEAEIVDGLLNLDFYVTPREVAVFACLTKPSIDQGMTIMDFVSPNGYFAKAASWVESFDAKPPPAVVKVKAKE